MTDLSNPRLHARILERLNMGSDDKFICDDEGITKDQLGHIRRRYLGIRRGRSPDFQLRNRIKGAVKAGLTDAEISAREGYAAEYVALRRREAGLVANQPAERKDVA